jgi:hypothetical protein
MTSSTTAALEWAAQVSAAAIRTHKTGSPVIAARSARTLGAFSAGASVSIRIWRDRSIRPRPIAVLKKPLRTARVAAAVLIVCGLVLIRLQ